MQGLLKYFLSPEIWPGLYAIFSFFGFHTAKMELNDRNILNVLHMADFADAHWELLGKQLIKRSALLNIDANRRGNPSLCLIDTISQWLRTDTKASWEKLAEAVAKVEQYEEATANTIRQKAGIGKTDFWSEMCIFYKLQSYHN